MSAKALLVVAALGGAVLAWGMTCETAAQPIEVRQPLPAAPDGKRIVYPDAAQPTLVVADGSTRRVRSLLRTASPMRYGDYVWDDGATAAGPMWVRVDLPHQLLSVFRGKDEIGTAVILYGTDGKPTPAGAFTVLAKAKEHRSSLYAAEMPYMLRLTGDGVAIHASEVRRGSATHGCIGVPLEFARRLFGQVGVGDSVEVVGTA